MHVHQVNAAVGAREALWRLGADVREAHFNTHIAYGPRTRLDTASVLYIDASLMATPPLPPRDVPYADAAFDAHGTLCRICPVCEEWISRAQGSPWSQDANDAYCHHYRLMHGRDV
jgi:hypothetical protein